MRFSAGLILENWEHGRHKHLWLSVGADLKIDTNRDLADVGGGRPAAFFVTFQGISAFEQTQTLTLTETWRCGSCVRVLCCLQWADVGVAGRLLWPSHASILCCLQLVAAVSAMSARPALNLTHTSSAAAYLLLYVLNKLPYGAPLLTLPLHPPTVAVCSSLSPWHPFSRPPAAIRAEQAALWQAGGRQDWSEGGGHVPDLLLPHILFGCASLYFLWCTSVYLTEQQSRVEEGVVFLTHTHTHLTLLRSLHRPRPHALQAAGGLVRQGL